MVHNYLSLVGPFTFCWGGWRGKKITCITYYALLVILNTTNACTEYEWLIKITEAHDWR